MFFFPYTGISLTTRFQHPNLMRALGIHEICMQQKVDDILSFIIYMYVFFLNSPRDIADNKVFFQHPDLMRALGIHETCMQLMVNTLNRQQQQKAATEIAGAEAKRIVVEEGPVEQGKVRILM